MVELLNKNWLAIDVSVDAFELAWSSGSVPEPRDFLPQGEDQHYSSVLQEILRVDIEHRWDRGLSRPLEQYLAEFPELAVSHDLFVQVAYEDYRTRKQAGESVTPEEYSERFGFPLSIWPAQHRRSPSGILSTLAENLAEGTTIDQVVPDFLTIGEEISGFQLLGELGRGAFSRVYLARQGDLANRPVVLKVSTESFGEAQRLARLQQTHIVPIYSVHGVAGLTVVCMPYYGALTFEDLLTHVRLRIPRSGAEFVELCRSHRKFDPAESGADAKNWSTLEKKSYVEVVLQIGFDLATALQHAHERGIVHRDLKPANLLLADDGRPMLMDFNLSEEIHQHQESPQGVVGGTLPYMSPEQLQAFRNRKACGDVRSDLYSLGLILFETLTGRSPFPPIQGKLEEALTGAINSRQAKIPDPRLLNPAVTPAVAAILRKCLAHDPAERYSSAAQLREDLERQMANLPLRHVPEPSLRERMGKWVRRHPRLSSASSIATIAGLLLLGFSMLLISQNQRMLKLKAREELTAFESDVRRAQVLALDAVGGGSMELHDAIEVCRRGLNRFHVRDNPQWRESGLYRSLDAGDRNRLQASVGEMLFTFASMMRIDAERQATPEERAAVLQTVLYQTRESVDSFPVDEVPPALLRFEHQLAEELKVQGRNDPGPATIGSQNFSAVREDCIQATEFTLQHRYREALPLWRRAALSDPRNLWCWYGLGNCYEQLSQPESAEACYTACIALAPELGDWYLHRGASYLGRSDFESASRDFDIGLQLQPQRLELRINRGLARLGEGRAEEALEDLNEAEKLQPDNSRVYLIRSRIYAQLRNTEAARKDSETALNLPPRDEIGWVSRGVARVETDPELALQDFENALKQNPASQEALVNQAHVLSEKLGRIDEAILSLTRAIELYPEDAGSIASRGVLLARQGKRKEALRDAELATKMGPSGIVWYQVAGIYALFAAEHPEDRAKALSLLASAFQSGVDQSLVKQDRDLDHLRANREFQELLRAVDSITRGSEALLPVSTSADSNGNSSSEQAM